MLEREKNKHVPASNISYSVIQPAQSQATVPANFWEVPFHLETAKG